jgi:hypothetical protein
MARPGDRIRDFVTANWYNEVTREVRKKRTGISNNFNVENFTTITVYNHEAVAKEAFTAVALNQPKIDHTGDDFAFSTKPLENLEPTNWAVLQEPLDARTNASAEAVVMGLSWFNFKDKNPGTRKFLAVIEGEIEAVSSGKAEILHTEQDETTNEWWGLILLGLQTGDTNFCKTLESCEGEYGPTWCIRCDMYGNNLVGSEFQVYWWDSILLGAQPGYKFTYTLINGLATLQQGACPERCFHSGSISLNNPDDAEVGSPFTHQIDGDDLDISGLPPGLSMDPAGYISGTPTEGGWFYPTVSGTGDKTGPGTVNPGDKCTITKIMPLFVIGS